jgi:hypothetical protein
LEVTEAKRYYVTLEVLDAEMNWDSTTIYIDSLDLTPPKVSLTVVPSPHPLNMTYLNGSPYVLSLLSTTGFLGAIIRNETYILSLDVHDEETGIASISWDFGDATKAGGPIVYHSYERSGLYRGSVTVKDLFNNTIEADFSVLVVPDTCFDIIYLWKENITYQNGTIHMVEDTERSSMIERWTIISILGGSIVIAFVILDITYLLVGDKDKKKGRKGGCGP